MLQRFLNAKIHHARVTQCDPEYVGSITLDPELLEAAGMRPNEAVLVLDVESGARFETYVILVEPGSGIVGLNGPCSRLSAVGNRLIILTFGLLDATEVDEHKATVVICDEDNRPTEIRELDSRIESAVGF